MSLGNKRTNISGTDEGHEYQQLGDWVPVAEIEAHLGPDRRPTGGVVVTTCPDPHTCVQTVLDRTAAALVGQMAWLGWETEKLGGGKPILCCECRHFQHFPTVGIATCGRVRINFVHAGYGSFAPCNDVNPKGQCAMFEARPPNPTPDVAMTEPLKPAPWWKFW